MTDNNNAIQQGLNAAQNAAQEEGMAGKVEELANRLDVGVAGAAGATNAAGGIGGQASAERSAYGTAEIGGAANVAGAADAGAPAAMQDGVRYDYDDSSNV
ncbi:hypothetical protein OS242_19710 [Tumebacillus sp. DT12]|uniref:Uncharacterized protein n=1 Tax=Tumebacillus lacus TaxID=2995335 RepID=A0ABT3X5I3_9BACL|nr:hypothetical protein [Tumebacillus lacus]MCX7572154.1 hypothetical protein [Tumebacillus lacus]